MSDLLVREVAARRPSVDVLDAPSSSLAGSLAASLAVAVAPSTGRFQPRGAAQSEAHRGQVLGHVTGGKGRADEVVAPVGGRVARLMVRPGQLVAAGQCLIWIDVEAAHVAGERG